MSYSWTENIKFNSDKLEFDISVSVAYRESLSRWSKYCVHMYVLKPKYNVNTEVPIYSNTNVILL